jgi:hypothetical protein
VQKFDLEEFNLSKLNYEVQYRINISNRFDTLETFVDNVGIYRTPKSIAEYIKTSAIESLRFYELKLHKTLYHEKCSE